MAQQTAVEFIKEKLNKLGLLDKGEVMTNIFEQAKQMEKEHMHKVASFWRGKENEIEKPIFQQYYDETFKNKIK